MREDEQISTSMYHLLPMKGDQLEKITFFFLNSGTDVNILQHECKLLASKKYA